MKMQRAKVVVLSTALSAGALLSSAAQADKTLDQILAVGQSKTVAAQQSQTRVNKLNEETAELLKKFKKTNKDIEGLRIYNAQYERQLANQLKLITELEESIDNVTVLERKVPPLVSRMLDGLEQFVDLDVPLRVDERKDRISTLRDNQDRADISVAEKFRQVLEAYSIEAEYGRKLDIYTDSIEIGGQEREVDVLAIGRIALVYQTKDTKLSGAWDKEQNAWVELSSGDYRASIREGIKIAKKQASVNVMQLPISAPEAAQ